jgi:hypothetical protein
MILTKIKLARMQQGIRQWDLAQRAGISESRLSKIETGRIVPSSSIILQDPVPSSHVIFYVTAAPKDEGLLG